MMSTRRAFLQRSINAATALATARCFGNPTAPAERPAELLVNHVGFALRAAKFCLLPGTMPVPFTVQETGSGRIVHQGEMKPVSGDFGAFVVGDLGSLAVPGSYQIKAGEAKAAPVIIDPEIYTPAIRKCIGYFAAQRCGDSRTGYHAPCHLDDGRRSDNGKHMDVTGGWHDACDVRKWVDATIYGMIGLSRVLEVWGAGRPERPAILDELRWGNQYFRKMQERDGYLMNYCGGDDGNDFTDNQIGTADDRAIHTEPAELPGQFQFIAAQAAMSVQLKLEDPEYARGCAEAASRCLQWCLTKRAPQVASSLAAGAIACARLHAAVGGDAVRDAGVRYMRQLLGLQVLDAGGVAGIAGFFRNHPDRPDPSREIHHGNLPLLALCEVLERWPDHPDAAEWRKALEVHAGYLTAMSARSAFGTIPFGLYSGKDPGGDRKIGGYWYRWFMKTRDEYTAGDWWVGINAHLASHGVGMCRAARLLHDPRLATLAQRQVDWIVGVNPVNASTVTGVGRNQPPLFVTGAFRPATPDIPGGVMNGLGGSDRDELRVNPGDYNTCEYWTPMVAYTMWLMAELQAGGALNR